jgi:hypothetical protein
VACEKGEKKIGCDKQTVVGKATVLQIFTWKGIVYSNRGVGWHGLSFIADKCWRAEV